MHWQDGPIFDQFHIKRMVPLAIAQTDIYTLAETKIFFGKLGKTVGNVCRKRFFSYLFHCKPLFCSDSKSYRSLFTSMTEFFLEEIGNGLKLLTIYTKEIHIYSAGIYLSMRSIWCLYC